MNFKKKLRDFFTLTKRSKGGFTLVELIVVIAILAILAGVAIPVYSGYVKKAEKAGDEQLLAAVNKAFTAAVSAAGDDITTINSATLEVDDDGKVDTDSLTPNKYVEDFELFYQGNENSAFKGYSELDYDNVLHVFKGVEGEVGGGSGVSAAYNQVLEKLLGSENTVNMQNLVDSVWGEKGAGYLTDKVDWTSDIATEMLADNESKFADMINNCGDSMMSFMGITDPEEQLAKANELLVTKMNQMIANDPEYAGLDAEEILNKWTATEGEDLELSEKEMELFGKAQNTIAVNNAILTAAKTSNDAADNIRDILKSNNPKGELIASVNSGMSDEVKGTSGAMGEVALAYAMYMSYAERNNIEVKDATDVLNGLDDDGFKAYVNDEDNSGNFDKDMQGYLASMDMINNSVQGNEDAITDVVLNGFNNGNLVDVLTQAMNSAKSGN